MFRSNLLIICLLFSSVVAQAGGEWPFLDNERIGAAKFIKENPEDNGRDVVVIVLDTGVDLGTPGLIDLPRGGKKIIDVQDFSGEGDVQLEKARLEKENNQLVCINDSQVRLFGYDKLSLQAIDSVIYSGALREEHFKNTVIPDVNNNGRRDDVFGVLMFNSDSGWVSYVDLDGDGNVDDEQPLKSYKEKLQSFQFRGRNPKYDRTLATFALNLFPDEQRVNFHYDGSSHGTHVAGLAAGYKINGQDGLNGIAPGAKIISLKIGDSRLSGGATTTGSMLDAYEYGIEFARHYDGPVVFNMSFGIGSEIEGRAEMDLTLNDLLDENEELLFVTSAGNEGPGISTVGIPAAAQRMLTVGAMNSKQTANNLYGAHLAADKIFVFSSRGGEVHKPDVLTPGGAMSTVPPYSRGEVKWGTSMASPQAAGAVALLMSAIYHRQLPLSGSLLKRAIINAAEPLPGYAALEQGGGVINVGRSFEFYRKMVKRFDPQKVVAYDISTVSPVFKDESGPTAYWRFATYVPDKNHKQRFYINPVFSQKLDADSKQNFYRAFNLKSSAPWLRLNKASTYIRASGPAIVDVYYDRSRLQKPGLYSAVINAYNKGGGSKADNKAFDLMCNVVVPLTFNESNHFHWDGRNEKLAPGDVQRYFIDVPAQATSATITMRSKRGAYANVRGYLFDPQGRETRYLRIDGESRISSTTLITANELTRGTWEFDTYADFRNEENSNYEVTVSFSALQAKPAVIRQVTYTNGRVPRGSFTVLNHYNDLAECKLSGAIMGVQRKRHLSEYSDSYEYAFSVDKNCAQVTFELELDAEVFNKFTDFAINIKDYSGKILQSDGLTYRKQKLRFIPEKSGDYLLELLPAFAAQEATDWQAQLTESYYYFNKIAIPAQSEDFYPRVEKDVRFEIDGTLPMAPEGFYLFGEIWLDNNQLYKSRTTIPIHLKTGIAD